MPTREQLIEAQMREYPTSRIIDIHAVYKWCDQAETTDIRLFRWSSVALALQDECAVFYVIPRKEGGEWRGFRFGIDGHQYQSLYAHYGE